ncbi:MAG: response regulator [Armatimonadota bacterium]|nr:response regulator [Armatimonadota bacterium]
MEDNTELRGFLALSLTEAVIDNDVAVDTADALRKIEAEKYDVVVIDSILGNDDGFSLAQRIRGTKNGRNVPIIIMSSIATPLARRMAKDVGCDELLVKPFSVGQFIQRIKETH